MNNIASTLLPGQYTGKQSDIVEIFTAADENEAKSFYRSAMHKMKNINDWHTLCGFLSPAFHLTDSSGLPVSREPVTGDCIRIDIPGPGTRAGKGYDWVRIEKIYGLELDARQEFFFMQVRPTSYPLSGDPEIAHFFDNAATSSFMLIRELSQVTAAVHGRNESPNTNAADLIDKIRNQVVGTSGALGIAVMQWKSLVKAVLSEKK